MKETFDTLEEALARVAEIDLQMGFPDNTGTLTWAVPTSFIDEDGTEKWEIPAYNITDQPIDYNYLEQSTDDLYSE